MAEGITVVNFDIEIDAEGIYRVAGDNYDMGYQSAQYIVDKIGTEGTVVILDVPTSGSVAELRKQGFLEHLAELAPDMETIEYATEFTREAGLADMADILTANSHIDAVFSMDDETSIGALQAIRDAGRTDIQVITGGGGALLHLCGQGPVIGKGSAAAISQRRLNTVGECGNIHDAIHAAALLGIRHGIGQSDTALGIGVAHIHIAEDKYIIEIGKAKIGSHGSFLLVKSSGACRQTVHSMRRTQSRFPDTRTRRGFAEKAPSCDVPAG